jgi:Leucine-rich repeat (LRR) protein
LAQCSALTQLNLSSNPLSSPQELGHLPEQLQALDLSNCRLTDLPLCLTRLTGLTALLLNDNPLHKGQPEWVSQPQLPGWVSQLQRLEVLELKDTGVATQQEVLSHLPLLQRLELQS